ncbi:unnamed protein product [Fraxinus pennsylvanica]|uniref:Uncharacterized protein n=1 Tax=Fraxinus pennsylvanica TaxID=56036 RepID=A0AAD1Z0B9_9LAMI|nr:unnamed protein product [Fraxinus pennsylvanica]
MKNIIDDKSEDLERTKEEMEKLKIKIDEQQRKRTKMEQVLRLKRQSLLTLQLTHEAIQLESQAFEESAAYALSCISNKLEAAGNIVVQLTRVGIPPLEGSSNYIPTMDRAKEEWKKTEDHIKVLGILQEKYASIKEVTPKKSTKIQK